MIRSLSLSSVMLLLGSCATPVPPSGGPVDRTPPDLISMTPPSNSVDFDGDRILFEFSEQVDRPSFERALSVVPELETPPEFDWSGRRVELKFQDSLSDATTFVFTIDNSLRDEHGVALNEPIVRAIATGSVIDSGVITGRVLDPGSGKPLPNVDVVATRVDTVGMGAVVAGGYRTQTGPEGAFALKFLPDAPFFVYVFEDRNRNKSVDAGELYAVPPESQFSPAPSDSLASSQVWWIVNPDTTAPTIQTVRPRSSRRIELRYSEPVSFDTLRPSEWAIRDTASGFVAEAKALYRDPSDIRRIVIVTDSLIPSTYNVIRFATVVDSAGNAARRTAPAFDVTAVADTARLQFQRFDPLPMTPGAPIDAPIRLTARETPGVQFNQFAAPEVIRRIVSVSDTAGVPRSFEPATSDGVTWRLGLKPPLRPGETVHVAISSEAVPGDTVRAVEFRRFALDETGTFIGHVESVDTVVVEIYREEGRGIRLETTRRTEGDYVIEELEVGSYRLRIFSDRDGDAAWDWGAIEPYEMPERLQWYPDSARVRAGWETVLDTLRFSDAIGG